VETTKQKEEKRKQPEPEEKEGMPQHRHCPPAKRRGDRNPQYHEEQQKDVAWILAAHPQHTCLLLGSLLQSALGDWNVQKS
jgi:hypothetical protein